MNQQPFLLLPYLKISSPDGSLSITELSKVRYTIGRLDIYNDIALPEKEGIITRLEHCILQKEARGWTITDKSTNGTLIEKLGQKVQLAELKDRTLVLTSGDIIIIHNWQLEFIDPNQTKNANLLFTNKNNHQLNWIFNISQQALFKIENETRLAIRLRPQLRTMLNYMANKNLNNNNTYTLCSREELIAAIWGYEAPGEYLDKLAKEIRDILKQQPSPEEGLETVVGAGYILKIPAEP